MKIQLIKSLITFIFLAFGLIIVEYDFGAVEIFGDILGLLSILLGYKVLEL